MQYRILIRQEDGTYWATVDELPGVYATGDTLDELREAVVEAITLYLADDDVAPSTLTSQVDEMRVLVPA